MSIHSGSRYSDQSQRGRFSHCKAVRCIHSPRAEWNVSNGTRPLLQKITGRVPRGLTPEQFTATNNPRNSCKSGRCPPQLSDSYNADVAMLAKYHADEPLDILRERDGWRSGQVDWGIGLFDRNVGDRISGFGLFHVFALTQSYLRICKRSCSMIQ